MARKAAKKPATPAGAIDNPLSKGEKGASADRDERGHFRKGWKGGPGNPRNKQVAKFRGMLYDSVTDDDFRAVCQALTVKAAAGDIAAIGLFFSYLIGKPTEVDPDGEDVQQGTNIIIEFKDAKVPERKTNAPDAPRSGDSKAVARDKP